MAKISVIILVCLLVGLSDYQAESIKSETLTEQTEEGLAEKNDTQNFKQRQETLVISTTDTPTTQAGCEPPIYMLWKELATMRERLDATVRALEETNRKLEASEKQLAAFTGNVTELRTMVRGQPRVAFSATNPISDGTIGPASNLYSLMYHNVVSNIGNSYSAITGYFTAPVQGVYYFSFTSLWWDGTSGGSLYRNGYKVVSWYGKTGSHSNSESNSAVLQLQAGDKVNVRLWKGANIADNVHKYSTFSGFLLFPMWSPQKYYDFK